MRTNFPTKKDSPENRELGFNKSLKYLSYRFRSKKEIEDYLTRKNFSKETIDTVIERLINLKFLNDLEFGKMWILERQKHKSKSKFVLKVELKTKGLEENLIEELLKDAEEDLETARRLFERKKEKMKNLTPEEFKKKIIPFLQRKGFSWGIIKKVLNQNGD